MSPPFQTKSYTIRTQADAYRLVCARCGRQNFGTARSLALAPCACGAVACGKARRITGELSIRLDMHCKAARLAMERARRIQAGVESQADRTNESGDTRRPNGQTSLATRRVEHRTRNIEADQRHIKIEIQSTPTTPRMRPTTDAGETIAGVHMLYDMATVPSCSVTANRVSGSVVCRMLPPEDDPEPWAASLAPELVALCHEAANRRSKITGAFRGTHHAHAKDERVSPNYVLDRLCTDYPLRGFAIRANDAQQRLQGFIATTTFTTWSRYFKWDSKSPDPELSGTEARSKHAHIRWDQDNRMALELEHQARDGDPQDTGVIWKSVGEISLMGSLGGGCGHFLMQLALEDMKQAGYAYAVVHATESSAGFFDRCGFIQVGALARYGVDSKHDVAYRHWTFPDQDVACMDASIMMALRLSEVSNPNFAEKSGIQSTSTAPSHLLLGNESGRNDRKREVVLMFGGVLCTQFKSGLWYKTNSLKVLLDGLANKGLVRPHVDCHTKCDKDCPAKFQTFPFFRINGKEFSHLEVLDPHRVYDFLCAYITASPVFTHNGRRSERPDGRLYNFFNDLGFLSRACTFTPAEGTKGQKDLYFWDLRTWNANKAQRSICNARKKQHTQPELIPNNTGTFPAHLYDFCDENLFNEEERALVTGMLDRL
jgi:hypothetical protein